ncbi:MAG: 3,4-dihydroxy-2-butanone-4-phosphate synthase [Moraxellaceae bacterium]|nr:3,4-dihydroxy-2-butanone-4-phosphate synthase [Moraxellaceae bacterium]MBP8853138.1 3,4-dihydroxy-2-butanone-4-phosphate synthase [Moraxellaceae bacterium]MBP9046226.1 3,4-dihydroxy-2-butanone-4-phosphate synthase [Moraxellaceae bacterium]MBP9731520.1 3,4-dihydroxy-2-butanone-4-phosphate synthase [Moraxellaceae bacterium]HQV40503.1 bifunctional 3,4-dihydroxy-2-butanone-4-phosphate synthase/GTP cyclohydrolase II [Moraxellaceae bacterium]
MALNTIEELITDIRLGRMVVLMDDEDRENEGDLVMGASHCRPEDINFMAKFGRGLICMPMTRERCEQLKLPLMVQRNASGYGTKFTVSIEAAVGVSTGISAADRACTVQAAVARDAKASDIVQPGHIFPLMAEPGGVLKRAGHTEASCDLARLAGLEPAGVICEIMNEDGTMSRRPDLEKFAEEHSLKIGTIADLIHYRMVNEQTVTRVDTRTLPTAYGDFTMHVYREPDGVDTHIALVKGDSSTGSIPTVRVHVVNPMRDLLQAKYNGRIGWSLQKCLQEVADSDYGIVVLIGHDYSSANIIEHIDEFFGDRTRAESSGMYLNIGTGSQILRDLDVRKMRLLSSPMKFNALSGFGLEIVEYVTTE